MVWVITGRTGRAGREGKAVTYFTDADAPFLKSLVPVVSFFPSLLFPSLFSVRSRALIVFQNQYWQCHSAIWIDGTGVDNKTAQAVQDEAETNGQSEALRVHQPCSQDWTGGCYQETVRTHRYFSTYFILFSSLFVCCWLTKNKNKKSRDMIEGSKRRKAKLAMKEAAAEGKEE
jgi:superfamily II DNA/RNA helicase